MYYLIFLLSVLVSSVSQVMLKKSANNKDNSGLKEYLNPLVIIAYGMFFGSTLLTTMAYKGVPLQLGPVLEASGYIYVFILGSMFLNEKITRRKIVGMIFIIAGIVVCSM